MAARKSNTKRRLRSRSGSANPDVLIPGLRYLVKGVDREGKTRTVRAHSLSAARRSRAAHAIVRGTVLDTARSKPVVMATIGGGTSHRSGAKKVRLTR